MKEAMKSIYLPEPAGHIVDAILAENHAEPRHIPIKSPALAIIFLLNMKTLFVYVKRVLLLF